MNFRKARHVHSRSATGSNEKNKKTKKRQRKNKGKFKNIISLTEKDIAIEKLKCELDAWKKADNRSAGIKKNKLSHKSITTSFYSNVTSSRPIPLGTPSKTASRVVSSRDSIIELLSGIPIFKEEDVTIEDCEVGNGQFGSIKLATINKLSLKAVIKIIDERKSSKKHVLAEAIVTMTLSGHNNFPYCFGMMNDNAILMEYLGTVTGVDSETYPTLAKHVKKGTSVDLLKKIFIAIFKAIEFMHTKKILHNDIKSDNVVVADTIKVIDFGKATMMTNPVIYSIAPGTTTHQMYNTRHRHLAYELRNVPGSKQSIATDTYSLGFMLKHAAATLRFSPLIQLGRMMKHTDPASRATIQNGLDKIQML